VEEENIFHENRENLRSHDEEETARLTLPQEATERFVWRRKISFMRIEKISVLTMKKKQQG
jgi:hypothetical protein